ncbi:MAG TPA: hypothetical protein VHJ99_07715, partial [Candidatus Dormibacteraeota bacterium]|nr:hypothetical protein [Candidatus Dormibacteraeota bacterium]
MLRKGKLIAAPSPVGIGAPLQVPEISAAPSPPGAGAVAPAPPKTAPVLLGGTGTWLGGRRPSSLVAFLAIFTMGPLILLSTLSVTSFYT